jgi:hypothetical protein
MDETFPHLKKRRAPGISSRSIFEKKTGRLRTKQNFTLNHAVSNAPRPDQNFFCFKDNNLCKNRCKNFSNAKAGSFERPQLRSKTSSPAFSSKNKIFTWLGLAWLSQHSPTFRSVYLLSVATSTFKSPTKLLQRWAPAF